MVHCQISDTKPWITEPSRLPNHWTDGTKCGSDQLFVKIVCRFNEKVKDFLNAKAGLSRQDVPGIPSISTRVNPSGADCGDWRVRPGECQDLEKSLGISVEMFLCTKKTIFLLLWLKECLSWTDCRRQWSPEWLWMKSFWGMSGLGSAFLWQQCPPWRTCWSGSCKRQFYSTFSPRETQINSL